MFYMVGVDGAPTMGNSLYRFNEISFWSPDIARTFIVGRDEKRCDLQMLLFLNDLAVEKNRIVVMYTWGGSECQVLKTLIKEFLLGGNLIVYDVHTYLGCKSLRKVYKEIIYEGPYRKSTLLDASRIYELMRRTHLVL